MNEIIAAIQGKAAKNITNKHNAHIDNESIVLPINKYFIKFNIIHQTLSSFIIYPCIYLTP